MPESVDLQPGEAGLFGYGSLLNLASLERTLGRRYDRKRYACRLQGWRRAWDSLCPNERFYFEKPGGERCYPRNILYLNVRPSPAAVNGVLYVISEQDLPGFDEREAFYDRVKITGSLLDIDVRGGEAYVYVGREPHLMNQPMPAEHAAIRASYIAIVENGLQELGPEFRAEYERSAVVPPEGNIVEDHL